MREAALTQRAKDMRKSMSEPEARLWLALRAKRFEHVKFRRQKVIGRYIADFAAREPMLVIEVDGDSPAYSRRYDGERTAFLNKQGYQVLRFSNSEVMSNLEGVLTAIAATLPLSQPSPLKGRGF